MAFTSDDFLLFITLCVAVFYAIPKKFRNYQWVVLLIASYAFYLASGIPQVIFLIASTALTYASTMLMQHIRNKNKAYVNSVADTITKEEKKALKTSTNKKIKRVQVITILLHLGLLGAIKYLNVLLEDVQLLGSAFNFNFTAPHFNIIVPLGISFFTFASMGYEIDIGRGRYEAEKNPLKVALFVSFFPSVVQGPINRFDDVGFQLFERHDFDYDQFVKGMELILWGFFQKLVIADRVNHVVTTIFSQDYANYNGTQFFFAQFMYFIQIYADFAGGIDVARGVAELFGIKLPENFRQPFFATSMSDYWTRWHISLTMWMREYVFYPVMLSKPVMGLSKKANKRFGKYFGKLVPSTITPFVVFFLMGIWHGADLQHIIYGIYNATAVSAAVALDPLNTKLKSWFKVNTEVFSYKVFCMLRVFLIGSGSRLIVKAPDITALKYMVKHIFTDLPDLNFIFNVNEALYSVGLDRKNMLLLIFAFSIRIVVSILREVGINVRDKLHEQNLLFKWIVVGALFFFVLIFGEYGPGYDAAEFLYQAY